MKKSVKWFAWFLVVAMALSMLLACGTGNGDDSRFVGTWVEIDSGGTPTGEELVFAKNGGGKIRDNGLTGSISWSLERGHLFITVSACGMSETLECEYQFSGDRLYITDLETGETDIFVKR